MRARLILEIVQTTLEEIAILAVGLFALPRIGIRIPVPIVAAIMLLWLAYSVFGYRKGTKALLRKPVDGFTDMTGQKGSVVKTLDPEGMVKIRGELWAARSQQRIEAGAEVVVVAQEGLKLIVRAPGASGGPPAVHKGDHDQHDAADGQSQTQDFKRSQSIRSQEG